MPASIAPLLMFTGQAEQAIQFYVATFPKSEVLALKKYGADAADREGTVELARLRLSNLELCCIDSPPVHAFTFTPSISLFVNCESEAEIEALFGKLSTDGQVFMPLDKYPFSRKFGWTADRFGVSWQLNLA
ncbi:MAG: VOC family protein [Planctomycetota bacterium]